MERIFGRFLAVFLMVGAANLPAQTLMDLGGVNNDGGAFVNFGIADSSNNEKMAMPLSLSAPATISKIAVELVKVGNPTDNAVIEARQGSPDGTLLAGGSVGGSAISASGSRHEISVPAFTAAQNVYIVYSRSGPSDSRNFYKAIRGTSGSGYGIVTTGGYMYLKTGVGWGSSDLQNSPKISLFGSLVSLGQATISPSASISFGDTTVGLTKPRQFRIRNTGTAALTVNSVSSGSTNFNVVPAIAPNTNINVGDSLVVTVNFSPTATGSASNTITVTHNGVNSPTLVAVMGNGVMVASGGSGSSGSGSSGSTPPVASPPVPGITLVPTILNMDSTRVGGPGIHKTLEIKNDSTVTLNVSSIRIVGANASEFQINTSSAIIEAGGGKKIVVISFIPVTEGQKSSSIVIKHNAPGDSSVVPLTAIAGPVVPSGAAIAVSPTSVSYDTVAATSSKTMDVTISNSGTANLTVFSVSLGGLDPSHFSFSPSTVSVSPDSSRIVRVTFQPASVGPKSAVLVLANNTATPVVTIPLRGTTKFISAPPVVNITADVKQGHVPLTVHLANSNSGGIITRWEWQPGDRMATGALVDTVMFTNGDGWTHTYRTPGIYRPLLFVDGPGGGDTQSMADSIVVLPSQPLVPVLRVDVDSVEFSPIIVSANIQSSFRLANTGTGPLNGRITLDGDNSFSMVSADTFSIAAGAEDRTVAVRFAPQSAGVKRSRLIISYNGDPGLKYVTLSGEGLLLQVIGPPPEPAAPRPRLDLAINSINMGDVFAVFDTSYVAIPVKNGGEAVLNGWLSLLGDESFKLVSPDSIALAPGATDSVRVFFAPGTAGTKTSRLYLIHNAADRPYLINLSGEARNFAATVEMVDFDGNGVVNFGDFFLLAEQIGKTEHAPEEVRTFDLNRDREINHDDFFVLADFFGEEVR